ncbi:hypothetical protein O181_112628 [Austropuccinia psidii MF-1]|uniref:Uncharacterized protein n=1 Tax=Austropuccinia psidii MF-1 TaxID=1389203 RepID=A0A9Q3PSV6_9BASI|nr:hypothetical protein [Austropuccinia psidii MF-1]
MENTFEEAIFNIEIRRPISRLLKQKDISTVLNPDICETMVDQNILRECGGDPENSMGSRCIEPFSTEDYINAIKDITTRTKIGKNRYKLPIDNKASWKPISKPNEPQYRAPLKFHKCGSTSHLVNTCPKKTTINGIEIEKTEDTKEKSEVAVQETPGRISRQSSAIDFTSHRSQYKILLQSR